MRGLAAWSMAVIALAAPVLAADRPSPSAFVSRLIADAKAQGVFVDASLGPEARARHLASGLVCRFPAGDASAALEILPSRARGDNVGCTSRLGSGVLALQVQRLGPAVDAARFLDDMVEVVRGDFPGAVAMPTAAPASASTDGLGPHPRARFKAAFKGRPVHVEVSAVRVGAWMVSSHLVTPAEQAAGSADAEVYAAAQAVERARR